MVWTRHLQIRQERGIVDDVAEHRETPVQQVRAGRRQLRLLWHNKGALSSRGCKCRRTLQPAIWR